MLLQATGHYRLYQTDQAIEINQKVLDLVDPKSNTRMSVMNNLANCYRDQKKYNRAISLLSKCIELNASKYGVDHLRNADYHYNLALNYYDQGNFRQAFDHYQNSAAINKKTNPLHPYLIEDYGKIAECYAVLGQFEKAREYFDASLQMMDHIPGSWEHQSDVYSAIAHMSN